MLILVSKTVFVSVCTSLIAIRFSASAQLVSSDHLSCHGGGAAEEAAGEQRVLKERANASSKKSAASRLKYGIHLPWSGKDRDP
jgi:hypothetical protein